MPWRRTLLLLHFQRRKRWMPFRPIWSPWQCATPTCTTWPPTWMVSGVDIVTPHNLACSSAYSNPWWIQSMSERSSEKRLWHVVGWHGLFWEGVPRQRSRLCVLLRVGKADCFACCYGLLQSRWRCCSVTRESLRLGIPQGGSWQKHAARPSCYDDDKIISLAAYFTSYLCLAYPDIGCFTVKLPLFCGKRAGPVLSFTSYSACPTSVASLYSFACFVVRWHVLQCTYLACSDIMSHLALKIVVWSSGQLMSWYRLLCT